MKLEDFRRKSASWWSDMMTTVAFADKDDPFGVRLEMPSDCSPTEVVLFIMAKDSDRQFESGYVPFDYCLCFEDGFKYSGDNGSMKQASTGEPICFSSWIGVITFLQSMTDNNDPEPSDPIQTHRQPDPTTQVEGHPPYMDAYRAYPPRKARLGLGILSIVSRFTPMRPKVMEKPFCHSKLSIRLQWQ